jgi:hypothetical protein
MTNENQIQFDAYAAMSSEEIHRLWYESITQKKTENAVGHVDKFSPLLNLESLKVAFNEWFKRVSTPFLDEFCRIYREYKGKDRTLLVAALSDFLVVAIAGIPLNFVATVCILLADNRLETLCGCKKV